MNETFQMLQNTDGWLLFLFLKEKLEFPYLLSVGDFFILLKFTAGIYGRLGTLEFLGPETNLHRMTDVNGITVTYSLWYIKSLSIVGSKEWEIYKGNRTKAGWTLTCAARALPTQCFFPFP